MTHLFTEYRRTRYDPTNLGKLIVEANTSMQDTNLPITHHHLLAARESCTPQTNLTLHFTASQQIATVKPG
jgi:hypothetical protein